MTSPIPLMQLPPVDSLEIPEILNVWARNLNRVLTDFIYQVTHQVNTQVQGVGLPLNSASTLMPTHAIHKVSAVDSPVTSIHAPPGFTGPLFLIPTGAWTFATGGNIALSGMAVAGKLLVLVYDGQVWYPSYT